MNWLAQTLSFTQQGVTLTGLQAEIHEGGFWLALIKIMWINVLLSGDNALVIAMACRGLQPRQRFWGMIFGAGVAVFFLVVFTGLVAALLGLPYLKFTGGLALIFIAAKLLVPEDGDEDEIEAASHLWAAVRVVAVADIIMSLDNVIAVAAAANGNMLLLVMSSRDQYSDYCCRCGFDHGVAGSIALSGLVGCGAARLDCRRCHRNDPGIAPILHRVIDGQIALVVDLHRSAAMAAEQLQVSNDIVELGCSVLGVIVVLALGSYMRSRKMAARHEAVVAKAA